MQGVGLGLEDEENELNKTMSQIGGSMQESFANAVADIPGALSDLNAQNLGANIDLPNISSTITHQLQDGLEIQKQPIELSATLQIDGKDVPVSLSFAQNIANSINEVSRLKNRSIINI